MNKIQRNANSYAKLLNIEYIFYLAYEGKCKKIILRFSKENFHHLEGLGQLKDTVWHSMPSRVTFTKSCKGEITEESINTSSYYERCKVINKVDHLYLLESFIDNNDVVFNYIKRKNERTSIQAKIFLYKDFNGQEIYLFLDAASAEDYYYPKSFVVSPEVDYKIGQNKYTVLWKEKRNRITGESEVLSRFKEFDPEKVSA